MPNNNAWHDYQMQQFCKGVWIDCDNKEQAKHRANPLERLAEQNRAKARAQEHAEFAAKEKARNNAAEIGLIKVMRDLKANHPLNN